MRVAIGAGLMVLIRIPLDAYSSDADFMILEPGAYVKCAVTGEKIAINNLRYWSAELQEAYLDANAATARWREVHEGPGSTPPK